MSYIEEKLYSQAFENGVNYAIEKMFGGGKDDDSTSSQVLSAAGSGALGALSGTIAGVIDHKRNLGDHINFKDLETGKKINPEITWDFYRKVREKALENEKTKKIWREQLREHITPRAAVGFGVGTLADIAYNSYMKNKKKERD